MKHYEFDGELYKKASKHQKEWGNKVIDKLDLRETDHILDLGCGDGVLTKVLASRVPRGMVTGIDASLGMIEKARESAAENLQVMQLNINEMHFKNRFDLIFSNAALHWVLDHEKLLDNCYTALKTGGKIRFNFGSEGNCAHLDPIIREVMGRDAYAPYFGAFVWPWYMPSIEAYKKLMDQTSFTDVRLWVEPIHRYFANEEQITRWIDQPCIVPFLEGLEGEKKKAFRDEVVGEMLDATRQSDGTYCEIFCRINIQAAKT